MHNWGIMSHTLNIHDETGQYRKYMYYKDSLYF